MCSIKINAFSYGLSLISVCGAGELGCGIIGRPSNQAGNLDEKVIIFQAP